MIVWYLSYKLLGITSIYRDGFYFVLLVGGSLGLDLLMVISSVEAASSREEAFTPRVVLTASFPSGFGPWPGFEPGTFLLGEAPPTDVSVFGARPKPQVGSLEL